MNSDVKNTEDAVLLQELNDGLLTLTINRPAAHNGLNQELRLALRAAFESVNNNDDIRAVLITSAGDKFCVGQDIVEHGQDMMNRTNQDKVHKEYNPMIAALLEIRVPVVAHVGGAAAGAGWSLAMACDFRIAANTASFKAAFPTMGLVTDCGMSNFLPQAVGVPKAMEILIFDKKLSAEQALELGVVNEVLDEDAAATRAVALAQQLAAGPSVAFKEIKQLVRNAAATTRAAELEADAQVRLAQTADHMEAVQSFLEKRPPNFTGK